MPRPFIHEELPRRGIFSETRCLIYARFCMSIRSVLQAVAISSDESADLADAEGKPPARVGAGRPR